ncbi:MAG: ABC transporter permease [Pseudomonadota bacterium]
MTYFDQGQKLPFKYTVLGRILEFFRLVWVVTINKSRQGSSNALKAMLMRSLQMVVMMAAFYALISVTGLRSMSVRGDFMLFLASGIFLLFLHLGGLNSAMGIGDTEHGANVHAPVTPLLNLVSSALSQLHTNVITIAVILLLIHLLIEPVKIDNLQKVAAACGVTLLSGMAIGSVIGGIGSFIPLVKKFAPMVFMRVNMVFSGKMFAANSLPISMIPFFWWNPLFHCIDQARDGIFVNYTAKHTTLAYPLWLSFGLFALGFMLMHASKKLVSQSWSARQ